MGIRPLDEGLLQEGLAELARRDAALAGVLSRLGPPPLWAREPGFPTLLRIILEQQVSLASAQAAYKRLVDTVVGVTPASFLELDDDRLLAVGFSRQKRRYGRLLADAILSGELDLEALPTLDNTAVRRELTQITGIGPWTAEIYLLMALRRPDAWPAGDLALLVALQEVKELEQRPSLDEATALAEPWRPWRAVAARLLWHYYLNGR